MSDLPPPKFASYPRPGSEQYGTPAKLKALYEAYTGMSDVFAIAIPTTVAMMCSLFQGNWGFLLFAAGAAIISWQSWGKVVKLAFGMDWPVGKLSTAKGLIVLNALFFTLIGVAVVQHIALIEMRKYGVKAGALGVSRRAIQKRLAEMTARSSGNPYFEGSLGDRVGNTSL